MYLVLSLLPFALMPFFYAGAVKFAAYSYRRTRLQWRHAFGYAFLVIVAGLIAAALRRATGTIFTLPLAAAISLALQIGLGGWFFAQRAISEDGEPVKFKGGVVVTLIALGLMFLIVLAVAAIALILVFHGRQS